jgi:hypothetical protein
LNSQIPCCETFEHYLCRYKSTVTSW